jgi:flavorubredoxin
MNKPRRINDDTYMVMTDFPAAHLGILPVNWYLIKAKEPVLVDTGMPIERELFLATLKSLIEPAEIKWIFLTHDDNDHQGNLGQVMEIAPQARIVTNFLGLARMSDTYQLSLDRLMLINPGESFNAGDRELIVVQPPFWDSPVTHAVYDTKNSVLFSSDSLGALIPQPAENISDIPEKAYFDGFCIFASAISPWLHLVNQDKFENCIESIRKLKPKTILSSHGLVAQDQTDWLLKMLSSVPDMKPFRGPNQVEMLAIMDKIKGNA